MPYYRRTVIAGLTMEVTKCSSGRRGLKIPVAPKEKETTEKQKKQNEKIATDKLRWLINTNFRKGDWWATLTYPANARPDPAQVKSDISKFTREMRKIYRQEEKEFKYILTAVMGKRGAVHVHIVMKRIDAEKIADTWREIVGTKETPYPVIDFTPMDGRKNHADLASYIIKNSRESFYDPERRIYAKRYCPSRNLKKPVVIVEKIKAKNWRTPRPIKGYYIDKQYTYEGYNEDGHPYQHYIMVRLDEDG